jgi:hypothetical protein
MLKHEDPAHQALRAFDAPALAQLLHDGRVHPTFTLLPRGGAVPAQRGDSLLAYAVEYEWADGIALCMQHGGAPSAPEPCPVRAVASPLHGALLAWSDRKEEADALGATYALVLLGHLPVDAPLLLPDPNNNNNHNNNHHLTALMHAAGQNHLYAVRYLLERRGASKDARDAAGHNALWHAQARVKRSLWLRVRRGCWPPSSDASPPLDAVVAELL